MPRNLLGCDNLIKKLTKILFTHIKYTLPEINNEIKKIIKENEEELRDLGEAMPDDNALKMQLLWNMINDFIGTYKSTILGKYDPKRIVGQNKNELSGGAKIKAGYWNLYEEEAKSDYKACAEYSDMHI